MQLYLAAEQNAELLNILLRSWHLLLLVAALQEVQGCH
jgi:hypothetical protein